MTNFERIKAMSIEEMVEEIENHIDGAYWGCEGILVDDKEITVFEYLISESEVKQ